MCWILHFTTQFALEIRGLDILTGVTTPSFIVASVIKARYYSDPFYESKQSFRKSSKNLLTVHVCIPHDFSWSQFLCVWKYPDYAYEYWVHLCNSVQWCGRIFLSCSCVEIYPRTVVPNLKDWMKIRVAQPLSIIWSFISRLKRIGTILLWKRNFFRWHDPFYQV